MTEKQKQRPAPVFPVWSSEQNAGFDAYWQARKTGVACAVVRLRGGLYQAQVLPLPKSARIVAIINAKKARTR